MLQLQTRELIMIFQNRFDAAEHLSAKMAEYKNNPDVIILAVPRGGLQIGRMLAEKLHAPLDIILTKKIGYPGNPEYAIGAVTPEDVAWDESMRETADQPEQFDVYLHEEIKRIHALLHERAHSYRGDNPPLDLKNKIVIVVDDGVATGKTLHVALMSVKRHKPKKIIVAVPVISQSALALLKPLADDILYLSAPPVFFGVGQFYQHFPQVEDAEAIKLLHEAFDRQNRKPK